MENDEGGKRKSERGTKEKNSIKDKQIRSLTLTDTHTHTDTLTHSLTHSLTHIDNSAPDINDGDKRCVAGHNVHKPVVRNGGTAEHKL